jgi:hypothetical protein
MVAQAVSPALPILDDFRHGLLISEPKNGCGCRAARFSSLVELPDLHFELFPLA